MARAHPLSKIRLFAGIPDEDLARIEAAGETRTYPDGETLFSEGDAGTHMYAVLEGRVQLSVALHDKTEQAPVHVATEGSGSGGSGGIGGRGDGRESEGHEGESADEGGPEGESHEGCGE